MYYTVARIDIHDTGFDQAVEIKFDVSGRYRPQTYFEPAEHAEVEVYEVTYAGDCIVYQLTDEHNKIIEAACWAELEELKQQAQEDYIR